MTNQVKYCLESIEQQKAVWHNIFHQTSAKFLQVYYEDLPDNPTKVIDAVINYLDVDQEDARQIDVPILDVQRNVDSLTWVDRFNDEFNSSQGVLV